MTSHVIDSEMFCDQYGTEKMRKVFSDEALIKQWLTVWSALATAEAEVGVIPKEAAEAIAAAASTSTLDAKKIKEGFKLTAHPLMPQIRLFEKCCPGNSGGFIHWGATTQDVMDSAVVLQLKEAQEILVEQVKEIMPRLAELGQQYKNTPMAGRTHAQHALPITLGMKFAIYLDEFGRHLERIQEGSKRYLVASLFGAAGTMASLGDKAEAVQERYAQNLGLYQGVTPWHTARDGFAEFANIIAMLAGTTGKIANEFINLQRTEIGELEESFTMDRIGSSTMPQKRNPMLCENMVANVRIILANATLAPQAMLQEHERDMTFWQAEWSYLPQICILLSGSLAMLQQILNNLLVHEDKLQRNLMSTKGLIVSEHIMLVLGKFLGRQTAHDIIHHAAMEAFDKDCPLADILLNNPTVMAKVDKEQLLYALDPLNYTGIAAKYIDKAISKWL